MAGLYSGTFCNDNKLFKLTFQRQKPVNGRSSIKEEEELFQAIVAAANIHPLPPYINPSLFLCYLRCMYMKPDIPIVMRLKNDKYIYIPKAKNDLLKSRVNECYCGMFISLFLFYFNLIKIGLTMDVGMFH